ncbi:MAG: hypothetical protein KBT47_03065 [Armatimonadetes bacterium]|nr:hypothetical protein [Candidatus Hippobium faecium]
MKQNDEKLDILLDKWKIDQPSITSQDLISKLTKNKKNRFMNFTKIGVAAACLILLFGSLYVYNQKHNTEKYLFDGSNSDLICYSILMDCNYEK